MNQQISSAVQIKKAETPQWAKLLFAIGGIVLLGYLLVKLIDYLFPTKTKRPRIFISHSWKHEHDYWLLIEKMELKEFRFYNHSISCDDQLDADTAKQIETGIWKQMK